jgi:hypothetical protein
MKALLFLLFCVGAVAVRVGVGTDLANAAEGLGSNKPWSLSATCVAVGNIVDRVDADASSYSREAALSELTAIIDGADAESRRAFHGFVETFRDAYVPRAGSTQAEAMVDFRFAMQNVNSFCRAEAGTPTAG